MIYAGTSLAAPVTITGVTAATMALPGPVVTPTAGMCFEFDLWGQVTTTVDTQTFSPQLMMGGLSGTPISSPGAQNPNSGATVSAVTIRFHGSVQFQSPLLASTVMQIDLNFFTAAIVQSGPTAIPAAAGQLAFVITPSATALDIVLNGGYWTRTA